MTGFVSRESFPRLPLLSAGVLLALVLALVATSRVTGTGASRLAAPDAAIARDLRFEDRADGSIAVFDAADGAQVAVLPLGADGFIRGVLRSFARERRAAEAAATTATAGPPFRLSMTAARELSIQDLATGRLVELNAFGDINSGAFAQLLPASAARGAAR